MIVLKRLRTNLKCTVCWTLRLVGSSEYIVSQYTKDNKNVCNIYLNYKLNTNIQDNLALRSMLYWESEYNNVDINYKPLATYEKLRERIFVS